jgi:serine protease Do
VPIDRSPWNVAQRLRTHGSIIRGRIGVQLQEVTPELAQALHLPRAAGALITAVEKQAPAERAGLRSGDAVIRVGGAPVADARRPARPRRRDRPRNAVDGRIHRATAPRSAPRAGCAAAEEGRPRPADVVAPIGSASSSAALSEPQRRRWGLEGGLLVQRAEGAARRAASFAAMSSSR